MGYRKLGRRTDHRRMLLRNLVTSFLKDGHLQTTEPRGKELQSLADKMITLGKQGDLAARRRAMAYLLSEDVVTKLFKEIAPRYNERAGGYTRLVKVGYRQGDGSPMVLIELV